MFVNGCLTMISPLNFKPNTQVKSTMGVSKTSQCHVLSLNFHVAHSTQCHFLSPCQNIAPLLITFSVLLQLAWHKNLLNSESLKMTLAYNWHSVSIGKSMNTKSQLSTNLVIASTVSHQSECHQPSPSYSNQKARSHSFLWFIFKI